MAKSDAAQAVAAKTQASESLLGLGAGFDFDKLMLWAQTQGLKLLASLAILLIGLWIAKRLSRALERVMTRANMEVTLRGFLRNIAYAVMVVVVAVAALQQLGVPLTSVLAVLGAAGLAIGLALQGTLQNIAAGIMLLILRPFRVGEYIETSSISGTVREIGLFATEFKTGDGLYRLAPNSILWNTPITHYSREPTRQNELKVTVAYADDIDAAMDRLLSISKQDSRVLKSPAPAVFIDTLGGATLGLTLRYWAKTGDWWALSRDMVKRVKLSFDEGGHLIPVSAANGNAVPEPEPEEAQKPARRRASSKDQATRQ